MGFWTKIFFAPSHSDITFDLKIAKEPSDDFLSKVTIIQRDEFTYFKNMLIRAFEYPNRTGIDGVRQEEEKSF